MTMISTKRPSSPQAEPSNGLPVTNKGRRMNGPDTLTAISSNSSSSSTRLSRAPTKATEKGVRKPTTFNSSLITFFETVLEEKNFDEILLSLESMIAHHQIPIATHIRQLLALALDTSSSLGIDSEQLATPKHRSSSSSIVPPTLDPIPMTERKLRTTALNILSRISRSNGVYAILRTIPAHSPLDPLIKPLYQDYLSFHLEEHEHGLLGEDPDEEDNELLLASKRISQRTICHDFWAWLAGAAGRNPKIMGRENPITRGGWETLKMFVQAWQDEQRMKLRDPEREAQSEEIGFAPSLMPTLKCNTSDQRDVSSKLLDIVFWPFSSFATEESEDVAHEGNGGYKESEDDSSGSTPRVMTDEMELYEKKQIAANLLGLISNAAIIGRLANASWLSEIASRMRTLSNANVISFLELVTTSSNPDFATRLLIRYLESSSHPISAPDAEPQSSQTNPSPRRRTMSQQSSLIIIEPAQRPNLNLAADSPIVIEGPPSSSTLPTLTPSSTTSIPVSSLLPKRIGSFTRPHKSSILRWMQAVPLEIDSEAELNGAPNRRKRNLNAKDEQRQKKKKKTDAIERIGIVKRYLVELAIKDEDGVEECEAIIQEVEERAIG